MHRGKALLLSVSALSLLAEGNPEVLCAPLPHWAVAVDVRNSVADSPLSSGARGAMFLAGALDDSLRPDLLIRLSLTPCWLAGGARGWSTSGWNIPGICRG